jgi:hypothetical protein
MKKDGWYAAIAAAGLFSVAGLYGIFASAKIANPAISAPKTKLTASLPSPPTFAVDTEIVENAKTILRERDPFIARERDDGGNARGLNLPKLAPPVRFSDPGERATVTAVQPSPPSPAPVLTPRSESPPAPVPAQAAQRAQGSLTLRGVFPSPNGGRALVAMPGGQVVSVTVGGVIGGWRVLEIRQGAIRLGRGQRAILLTMPR